MNPIRNINLAGAGSVATHLARVFFKKGFRVRYIYNRSPEPGKILARKVQASWVASPQALGREADLIVLAVSDNALPHVIQNLSFDPVLVVHTAGSIDLQLLRKTSSRTGVFYPLQTFTEKNRVSFSQVPICIEATDDSSEQQLRDLADSIGAIPYTINSTQRKVLHVGAVMAGNFTNFLYALAEELTREYDIPFDLLKPLIRHTAANARYTGIFTRQTGPAERNDHVTMTTHKDFLTLHPRYLEVYTLMSRLIQERKQRDEL